MSALIKNGGVVYVSDGSGFTYRGELRGEWTLEQIVRAFGDGYNSGDLGDGEVINCAVRVELVAPFQLFADGIGGVKRERLTPPHDVAWE